MLCSVPSGAYLEWDPSKWKKGSNSEASQSAILWARHEHEASICAKIAKGEKGDRPAVESKTSASPTDPNHFHAASLLSDDAFTQALPRAELNTRKAHTCLKSPSPLTLSPSSSAFTRFCVSPLCLTGGLLGHGHYNNSGATAAMRPPAESSVYAMEESTAYLLPPSRLLFVAFAFLAQCGGM